MRRRESDPTVMLGYVLLGSVAVLIGIVIAIVVMG